MFDTKVITRKALRHSFRLNAEVANTASQKSVGPFYKHWPQNDIYLKGPLQLQKLDQSLAGDVVFAAEAYNEYHPVVFLTQRIMEGEGAKG